jgi:orotidine-5'-phosphate decarboxylase
MMKTESAGRSIALEKRIIFALDVPTTDEAKSWVRKLQDHVKFYKVGLQLFLAGGFHIVDWIVKRDLEVMLDLKFYDIPQTVSLAVSQLNGRGVSLTTVHGNREIMKAAAQSKRDLKILAVTVLTSMNESDLRELGYATTVEDLVLSRARQALEAGCDGVVASGREIASIRTEIGNDLLIVTPGVRPFAEPEDDQKRTVDVGQAISLGADHVVIGRPIRDAQEPISLVNTMKKAIVLALAEQENSPSPLA